MTYTKGAVPIEHLELVLAVNEYCKILGLSPDIDLLFLHALNTLEKHYREQNGALETNIEYLMAVRLLAKEFSDSTRRIERNNGRTLKINLFGDCEYHVKQVIQEVPDALRKEHHKFLSRFFRFGYV